MKALVLGASGFLGSYLGYALPKRGWEVTGVSRTPVPYFPGLIHASSGEDYTALIQSSNADVIINAVAMASHEHCEQEPELALRVNESWPAAWAAACGGGSKQFVHISTDAVFSGESDDPYREGDPAEPSGVYGQSKLQGERAVRAANPHSLIVRTNFFGWSARSDYGILDFFVRSFSERTAITGFRDYVVSSMYVGDLVDALAELVESESEGLFHVVASDAYSKYDFGILVADALGLDPSAMAEGSIMDATGMAPRGKRLELSTQRVAEQLGRPMPTLVEGIQRAQRERDEVMKYFGSKAGETTT